MKNLQNDKNFDIFVLNSELYEKKIFFAYR